MNLNRMFQPQSVAFIGLDDLAAIIQNATLNDFPGTLQGVHPTAREIENIPCVSSVSELGHSLDLAILNGNDGALIETVQELAALECGSVICLHRPGSDAGEMSLLLDDLRQNAQGMPILGPDCFGQFNLVDGLAFSHRPVMELEKVETGIAVISSSPSYLEDIFSVDRNLPIAYAAGIGSTSLLSAADLFDYYLEDERVTAIHLYLEQINDIARLSESALKAARKGVPVVVVKGGRTEDGQRFNQTAYAAGIKDVGALSALFERLGFIECKTAAVAIETLKMLIYTGRPLGTRVGLVARNHSATLLGTDAAVAGSLNAPELDSFFEERLQSLLPEQSGPTNPLKINWMNELAEDELEKIYNTFLGDNFNIAVKVLDSKSVFELADEDSPTFKSTRAFAKEAFAQSLPSALINCAATPIPKKAAEMLAEHNMAPLHGLSNGFKAMVKSIKFVQKMILMAQMPGGAIQLPEPAKISHSSQYDEYDAKDILKKAGIWVPRSVLLDGSSPFDVSHLNYPMVTKVVASNILHKTEIGGVRLDLSTEKEVRDSIFEMGVMTESIQTRGFLIEEMVTDGIAEMLIGVRHAAGVGQVLTLAMGGIAVELLQDTRALVLPVSSLEIETALRGLRLFPLMNGYRGKPAADIDKVVESISILASYAFSQRHRLFALEINPLIIRPFDYYPVAVDAIIQVGKKTEDQG